MWSKKKDDSNIRALVTVLKRHVDQKLFNDEVLRKILAFSLERFNAAANYTTFEYENTEFVLKYSEPLLQGAILYASAIQHLVKSIDKDFEIPSLEQMMQTPVAKELEQHRDKLYQLKDRF